MILTEKIEAMDMELQPEFVEQIVGHYSKFRNAVSKTQGSSLQDEVGADLVLYNQERVNAFFEYRKLLPTQLNECQDEFSYDSSEDGCRLINSLKDYSEICRNKFGDEKTTGILNILFDIRPRFLKFHHTWRRLIQDDTPRLLCCNIVTYKTDSKTMEDVMRLMYSHHNMSKTPFEENVEITHLRDCDVFGADIAMFYHLSNIGLFNHLTGISKRLKVKKGKTKVESIGKNDYAAQNDPNHNPLHPESLKGA